MFRDFMLGIAACTVLGSTVCVGDEGKAANPQSTSTPATTAPVAASTVQSPPLRSEARVSPTTESISDLKLELALLKQQNEIIKGGQADLLQTVYFALGTVVLLALALTGYSWWTNFRVYERDKDALTTNLNATIAGATTRLEGEVKLSLSGHTNEVNEKVSSVKSELNAKLASVQSELNKGLARLEYDLVDLEADFYLSAESPSIAATSGIKQLKLAIQLDSGWRAKYAMDAIKEAIEDDGELYEREIDETLRMLEKVPRLKEVEPDVVEQARALSTVVRTAKIFVKKSE